MGLMGDLFVKKIAFVRSAATRRKFLIYKSQDADDEKKKKEEEEKEKKEKEEAELKRKKEEKEKEEKEKKKLMSLNAKVLQEVGKILAKSREKSETITVEQVIKKLKEAMDDDLSDAETLAIKSVVEFDQLTQKEKSAEELKKEKEEKEKKEKEEKEKKEKEEKEKEEKDKLKSETEKALETANTNIEKLEKRLATQEDQRKTQEVTDWIKKNARFAVEAVDETAKQIVALEKTSEDAAKTFKKSLEKTSKLLEKSDVLDPIGSDQPGDPTSVSGLIAEVDTARAKSSAESKTSEITEVNKTMREQKNADIYKQYRKNFRNKSRRLVGTLE